VKRNSSNSCNSGISGIGIACVKFGRGSRSNSPRSVTIEIVNAAIIVLLILLATGVVVSPLLRLRAWLKRTPPAQEFQPPPDEDAD
jgi:hypothetical protein